VHRPDHDITVALSSRAGTTERTLLPHLLAAGDDLHPRLMKRAHEYVTEQSAQGKSPGSQGT
jgi:hypothetical protein